jgi:lipoprotein-anchoring transpeptidase ErfK/SrfK
VARHPRRRKRQRTAPLLLAAGVVLIGWWVFPRETGRVEPPPTVDPAPQPALISTRPETPASAQPPSDVPERGENPVGTKPSDAPPTMPERKAAALIESGKQALAGNDLIAARSYFSDALAVSSDATERSMLRAELTRIGNETVFSARVLPNDPLVERYVIQTGDSLGKIAKAFKVPDDLIARINDLHNKNLIRAGQAIKVIKGPFRAVVDSKDYTLGLYLGDTFVKQFPVGLGQDESTPHGEWEVATKLVNPTYYPARGGQIVAADDPENPLGERWIGLHGTSGEAVGQLRYGIHGTNEPDSIGKSVSLGCIRMHNEDVEFVYDCLVEKDSTVIVR